MRKFLQYIKPILWAVLFTIYFYTQTVTQDKEKSSISNFPTINMPSDDSINRGNNDLTKKLLSIINNVSIDLMVS